MLVLVPDLFNCNFSFPSFIFFFQLPFFVDFDISYHKTACSFVDTSPSSIHWSVRVRIIETIIEPGPYLPVKNLVKKLNITTLATEIRQGGFWSIRRYFNSFLRFTKL